MNVSPKDGTPGSKAHKRTLGRMVQSAADTTCQALMAAEAVAEKLTSVTRKMAVGVIHSFQEVTAAMGQAMLENTRATVKGVGLVGADVGAVAKGAALGMVKGTREVGVDLGSASKSTALGLIHGTAEVGCELGKVCKSNARSAINGAAEVGALTKVTALGAIKGTTEAALSLGEGVLAAASALFREVGKLRGTPAAVGKVETAETPAEASVPATTNILSVAPVVVATVNPKRSTQDQS